MSDVSSVLLGTNNSPVLKFPQGSAPITHKGSIIASQVRQATDINQVPKTFDDGSPKLEVVITLATDLRDPGIEEDNGHRRLIAGFEMQKAIGQAMREAGCKTLDNGGELAVQYTGDRAPERNGFSPTKLFRAQYRPPAAGAGVNDLLGGSSADIGAPSSSPQPQAQPPAQQQPVSQPTAEPAGSLL